VLPDEQTVIWSSAFTGIGRFVGVVVTCERHDGGPRTNVLMKGSENSCVINGLAPTATYTVRVMRRDIKGSILYRPFQTDVIVSAKAPKYVVLVGASVGEAWNLPSLPTRAGVDGLAFGYRGKHSYDKTDLIERVVKCQVKPEAVIIKECAAYFPRESEAIFEKLPIWVDILRTHEITPILSTCCPVTESHDRRNPGRQDAVNRFNKFVRAFAVENGIKLLDLAEALQVSDTNRHLSREYAQADGLHLTGEAYARLDSWLISLILDDVGNQIGESKG
jgi:hypothetical protein